MKLYTLLALLGLIDAQQRVPDWELQPTDFGISGRIGDGTGQQASARADFLPLVQEYKSWNEWVDSEEVQHNAEQIARGFGEALNEAKMRLDIQGAHIFKQGIDLIKIIADHEGPPESCNIPGLYGCYVENEQYGNPFTGLCAQSMKCTASRDWSSSQAIDRDARAQRIEEDVRTLVEELQQEAQQSAAMYLDNAMAIASSFQAEARGIAIDIYGCNTECVDQILQTRGLDGEQIMETCDCYVPFRFEMDERLLLKSPDMQLYNLMKVDTPNRLDQRFLQQLSSNIAYLNKIAPVKEAQVRHSRRPGHQDSFNVHASQAPRQTRPLMLEGGDSATATGDKEAVPWWHWMVGGIGITLCLIGFGGCAAKTMKKEGGREDQDKLL